MTRVSRTEWLQTFVALCDHGSFTSAAKALHRSQSRVSTHIAELEHVLGQRLIDRSARPATLTAAGAVFAPHARSILAALDAACDDIDRLSGKVGGRVVLGAHPSISSGWLSDNAARLMDRHPRLSVTIVERTTSDMVELLREGTLDLAVLAEAVIGPGESLRSRPLWQEPYVAVLRADDAVATAPEPIDLVQRPLVGISSADGTMEPEFSRWANQFDVELPSLSWSTDLPQTVLNLVRAGVGVGVINQTAFDVFDHADLVEAWRTTPPFVRNVALWWDSRRHLSSTVRALADFLIDSPVPNHCHASPVEDEPARPESTDAR